MVEREIIGLEKGFMSKLTVDGVVVHEVEYATRDEAIMAMEEVFRTLPPPDEKATLNAELAEAVAKVDSINAKIVEIDAVAVSSDVVKEDLFS